MLLPFKRAERPLWEGKTSIYDYIRDKGDQVHGALPDDEEFWSGSKMRWVAGGLDGAMGHHYAGSGKESDEVRELVHLLAKHSRKPKPSTRKSVYAMLVKTDIPGLIDVILGEIRKHPGVHPGNLFQEAQWLAENGTHRNAVKFGIASLGLFEHEGMKELLMTLGRHDEFTLYAAVAIQNGLENSNELLFELAKQVYGWGRIHLVERLEPNTQEIRDWLLRYGYQNSVMHEYLACICARNGNWHEALSADQVDHELFDGAGDILQALLAGGPAENVDDYEHAPQAIAHYVRLAKAMCTTAKHLSIMMNLHEFLTQDEEQWAGRMSAGWTSQLRSDMIEACQAILSDPKWGAVVMEAVNSANSSERYYGVTCAEKLGLDIWENLYDQLTNDPKQEFHYLELMKSDDPARVHRLVQFAAKHLPLEQIAVGPGTEMGFGKEYVDHRNLDTILQSLGRFEGLGRELILAGLNSPVVRNRSMALMALEGWNASAWGEQLTAAVIHLSEVEPDESAKECVRKLREANGL